MKVYAYKNTEFYEFSNLNPKGRNANDCVCRAISGLLDQPWETSERLGVLQQTLYKIQEIWRSTVSQKQSNFLIRKLSPLEYLKLMGFDKNDYEAMREIGMSDSQIYHCAGDSIVTTVLVNILFNLINTPKEPVEKIINDFIAKGNKEE